jgi:hypothetical protein
LFSPGRNISLEEAQMEEEEAKEESFSSCFSLSRNSSRFRLFLLSIKLLLEREVKGKNKKVKKVKIW